MSEGCDRGERIRGRLIQRVSLRSHTVRYETLGSARSSKFSVPCMRVSAFSDPLLLPLDLVVTETIPSGLTAMFGTLFESSVS